VAKAVDPALVDLALVDPVACLGVDEKGPVALAMKLPIGPQGQQMTRLSGLDGSDVVGVRIQTKVPIHPRKSLLRAEILRRPSRSRMPKGNNRLVFRKNHNRLRRKDLRDHAQGVLQARQGLGHRKGSKDSEVPGRFPTASIECNWWSMAKWSRRNRSP
jgi:hypothetical protein